MNYVVTYKGDGYCFTHRLSAMVASWIPFIIIPVGRMFGFWSEN